uniref:Transmembrane protein 45a n=1 Tax=Neogobius melanostomus TaxID=47308 RepID=A0A8C6TVR5_9GOBI
RIFVLAVINLAAVSIQIAGAKLPLYNYTENHWRDLKNWQHFTMFMFVVSLIVHTTAAAPLPLDTCFYFVESLGLLISYHIHGQAMDMAITPVFYRRNLVLMRSTFSILQGTWYWQWDLEDHSNMMFVVMCFSWHLMSALLCAGLIYGTISCVVCARLKRTSPMGLLEKKTESVDEVF